MPQTILVPLDGSPLSEQAIPYARAFAKAGDTEILFMRAVPAYLAPGVGGYNSGLRDATSDYLDRHVEAARAAGLRAQALVMEDEPGYAILRIVEASRPEIIVMSTHGRTGLGRVLWGSVADYILHHTSVPALLIPKGCDVNWASSSRPRFVVPLDGSSLAEEALPAAEALARSFGGELVLIEAIEPSTWLIEAGDPYMVPPYDPSLMEYEALRRQEAGVYLDRIATALNEKGITASVTVADGRAARVIREAVRDNQAMAVVMSTHGQGGATRLLMGSVTDSVVRSARIPVLVVRPTAARAEAGKVDSADETTEQTATVSLTRSEVAMARTALRHFVTSSSDGEPKLAEAYDLLERLNQVEPERSTVGAAL